MEHVATEDTEIFSGFIAALRKRGAKALPPAAEDEIAGFELKHSVQLPTRLCAYFSRLIGTSRNEQDEDLSSFWSVGELEFLEDQCMDFSALVSRGEWLVIADYFIGINYLALCCSSGNVGLFSPSFKTESEVFPATQLRSFNDLDTFPRTSIDNPADALV